MADPDLHIGRARVQPVHQRRRRLCHNQLLVDVAVFVLNLAERIFVHVGYDPLDNFKIVVHMITPSSLVPMSPNCLKRLFRFLESCWNSGPHSSLPENGRMLLGVLWHGKSGRPLWLFRPELRALQNVKRPLFQSILRKSGAAARRQWQQQFEIATKYLKSKLASANLADASLNDLFVYVNRVPVNEILAAAPGSQQSFISQIKPYACFRVSERWRTKNLRKSLRKYLVFRQG